MKVLFKILPQELPVFVRQVILVELFKATADGFETPVPALRHLSYTARLQAYAVFTKEQAEKALVSGIDAGVVKERLYQNAYTLGMKLCKWFGIENIEDVMRMGKILYNVMGIEICGNAQGEVTVKRCFFSPFYSGRVCALISSMDEGLFSGLSGGRRLVFSERLTEGSECCKAILSLEMNGK
jgi:hypothetical protein